MSDRFFLYQGIFYPTCNNKTYYNSGNATGYEKGKQDGLAQASYHMVQLTGITSSGSVNVSSYPGYQNFTVNNFVFRNLTKASMSDYSRAASYNYNPNTGVFTFKHGGGWCYWDGPYISACGAAETWLIY